MAPRAVLEPRAAMDAQPQPPSGPHSADLESQSLDAAQAAGSPTAGPPGDGPLSDGRPGSAAEPFGYPSPAPVSTPPGRATSTPVPEAAAVSGAEGDAGRAAPDDPTPERPSVSLELSLAAPMMEYPGLAEPTQPSPSTTAPTTEAAATGPAATEAMAPETMAPETPAPEAPETPAPEATATEAPATGMAPDTAAATGPAAAEPATVGAAAGRAEGDLSPEWGAELSEAPAAAPDPAPPSVGLHTADDDDPPLAMEAKRAVQVLNPSGEVTMPRPAHPRIICGANPQGGVGKTTPTGNLAVALALHGNRVVVIDLDPQGNASTGLNVPHHAGVPDVYDCLVDTVALADVAQPVEGIPNLTCVPATIDLAGAEIELVSVVARESRLARAIAAYPHPYDYLLIDCPPSLGLLTVNALVAAREVLIPIQCEYYALEGLNQLLNNINLVRAHLNPTLDITTILLTMYDRRTRLADMVEQDVRNHFGDKVLQAVIPRNVRVSEAPSYGQSVMTYDPGSRGATSYFEAAQEIAERGAKLGGVT